MLRNIIRVALTTASLLLPCAGQPAFAATAGDAIKARGAIADRGVFRVGFPPNENPQEIIRKNAPLLAYLKTKTGIRDMEIIIPKTYTAAIEQMQRGELDMVYFGGLTYVLARKEVEITPIVRDVVDGSADSYSLIIARKDRGISSLADLRGKTFAFGDIASTSGSLIPHQILLNNGIDPNADFKKVIYTGAHDKTALAVFDGQADAGAMNARKLPAMIEKGQIAKNKLQVLVRSEPFADSPWAVRDKVGDELIEKLRQAFIELTDPAVLGPLGVQGYQSTTDGDFEHIRTAAKRLGFLED